MRSKTTHKTATTSGRFCSLSMTQYYMILLIILLASCTRSTPPQPNTVWGSVDQASYFLLDWQEGLQILVWDDMPHGAHGSNSWGSTSDPVFHQSGSAQSADGRGYEYSLETSDGQQADFTIDGSAYDLAQGKVFLIRTAGGAVKVEQLELDLSSLSPTKPGIEAFGRRTPEIANMIAGSSLMMLTPTTAVPNAKPTLTPPPARSASCLFVPYGIGGEMPVYHSPDVNSPVVANIPWGEKYPVLDRQGEWHFEKSGTSGQFYQIQLDGLNVGWVLDVHGGLEGNCDLYQDQVVKPPIFTGQTSPANDCSFEPVTVISHTLSSATPLRVIFIAENGIRLWDEESNTVELLFEADDVTSLAFSDDHQLIAFTRRNAEYQTSLWIMDDQVQAARELISPEELLTLNLSETKDLAVAPYILKWIPGSHRLAFSTLTTTAEDAPPDVFQELRVLDADSGSLTQLLDHRQGGTYTFSPDGAFFALVSDTSVSLYRSNGELLTSNIVTYPALGVTDFYHHPSIYWDANSRFFTFAVINAADNLDAIYNPNVTSTIWRVLADGSAERLATLMGMSLDHAFSPDLEKVAFMRVSPKGPPLREMHIADVYYAWDVIYREGDSLTFGDWNPVAETLHFTFFDGWGEPSIGRLCYDPIPLPSVSGPGFTYRVSWVDATRYLYVTHPEQVLHLGSLRGSEKLVGQMGQEQVTAEIGPLKVYDFYVSPSATSSLPFTGQR